LLSLAGRLDESLTSWYEGADEHFGWNCKCYG